MVVELNAAVANWKCNFPMIPHVLLSVDGLVGLHFHAPVGALVLYGLMGKQLKSRVSLLWHH